MILYFLQLLFLFAFETFKIKFKFRIIKFNKILNFYHFQKIKNIENKDKQNDNEKLIFFYY